MGPDAEELMTVREAARECRRAAETIRRWVWEGKLPAQKLGNQLFVKRADLARFLSHQREERAQRRAEDPGSRLAALDEIRTLREQIRRRAGGALAVLEALDRSREAHP